MNNKKYLKDCLLSAAIGDIAGQPYEFNPCKDYDAVDIYRTDSRFTDDTVCTFACAEAILNETNMVETVAKRCLENPWAGYAKMFFKWIVSSDKQPYNSFGNGSAMRCSIAGWLGETIEDVVKFATETAAFTHNHPEAIKGAVAVASSIFILKNGGTKDDVRTQVLDLLYPNWKDRCWKEIHKWYKFDVTCQGSVPVAIICFLESNSFEDCLKKSIAIGGDADTLCAMSAPMAYAFYEEIPDMLLSRTKQILLPWMLELNDKMNKINGFEE